jgi:hypothetical protein
VRRLFLSFTRGAGARYVYTGGFREATFLFLGQKPAESVEKMYNKRASGPQKEAKVRHRKSLERIKVSTTQLINDLFTHNVLAY